MPATRRFIKSEIADIIERFTMGQTITTITAFYGTEEKTIYEIILKHRYGAYNRENITLPSKAWPQKK